jgi:hypothetical protein
MAMDSAPANGVTISWENLQKLLPQETKEFSDACNEDIAGVAYAWELQYNYFDEDPEQERVLFSSWEALRDAFIEKTAQGSSTLDLELSHYSRDNGGLYDTIDKEYIFLVHGVYEKTPAASAIADMLEDSSWTIFG